MKPSTLCALVLASILSASAAWAQFDGILNRLEDRLGKKIEDRMGGAQDKVIDKTFDKAEGTVSCAAGDPSCDKPKGGTAKCAASDRTCLSQAKANGQTVEITGD